MQVSVVGTGYVGLVTGVCLADFGHVVTCIDKDEAKISSLLRGESPIFEPGLDLLLASNIEAGRLSFSVDLGRSVAEADVVFVAVGTPARRGDGYADLSYIYAAAEEIAACLDGFTVVVMKSTVPVGTCDEVERIIARLRPEADVVVVSNPEFLREGAAIEDFKRPDRVVVGTEDPRALAAMTELYRPLSLNAVATVHMTRRSSELCKYASNAFLAMKVTFINEMADLSEKLGADVQAVARGMGLDKRIGSKFLHAGPGYGGSCFPKDTDALIRMAEEAGSRLTLIEATAAINGARKRAMTRKIEQAAGGNLRNLRVGILGLTFKPNTDDMRDSPSLEIVPALQSRGASVRAYDPQGMPAAAALMTDVSFLSGPYEAADGADVLVILTEWDQFRALDLGRIRQLMRGDVFVDLRNVYDGRDVGEHGMRYTGVGRA